MKNIIAAIISNNDTMAETGIKQAERIQEARSWLDIARCDACASFIHGHYCAHPISGKCVSRQSPEFGCVHWSARP